MSKEIDPFVKKVSATFEYLERVARKNYTQNPLVQITEVYRFDPKSEVRPVISRAVSVDLDSQLLTIEKVLEPHTDKLHWRVVLRAKSKLEETWVNCFAQRVRDSYRFTLNQKGVAEGYFIGTSDDIENCLKALDQTRRNGKNQPKKS